MTFFLDALGVLGRILVDVRDHTFTVKMTIRSIFIARKVLNGKAFGSGPGNFRFDAQSILAHDDVEETLCRFERNNCECENERPKIKTTNS